ncbi:MAG: family transporter [Rhodospirillales bacterium]|nr:family transporter [Rhodospirillales bacterium]
MDDKIRPAADIAPTTDTDPASPPPSLQRIARVVVGVALFGLAVFILKEFLPALVWAGIFGIATWPLYRRFLRWAPGSQSVLAPLLFTTVIGLVFVAPLAGATIEIGREARGVITWVATAQTDGLPVPEWVKSVPYVGGEAATWWQENLSDPDAATELFGRVNHGALGTWTRQLGFKLLHGMTIFVFTLLTLFFIYRSGAALSHRLLLLGDRLLGHRAERMALTAIAAVHGTVNGLVLVGLGEGFLLGVAYFIAGLPHPALAGVLTGVLGIIPFGAPLVFCTAALVLLVQKGFAAAIAVAIFGMVVVFVADHFIRPVLIGGAVRLPFLWVLLGILGGLETLGLLGLFVGPAVMAVLVSLWRDWTDDTPRSTALDTVD